MKIFTVVYSYSCKYSRLQGRTIRFRGTTYFLVRHLTFVTKSGMSRNLLGLRNKQQQKIELKGCKIFCKALKNLQKVACCLENIKFKKNELIITKLELFKSPYNKKPIGCTIYFQLVYRNCCIYRVAPTDDV
jgi:hypothetical protein